MSEKTNLAPEGITEEFGSLLNMYESILFNMEAVAYINDVANGRLLWANDQYFNLLGYSRKEVIEMKNIQALLEKIVHPEDVEVYQTSIMECIKSGQTSWGGFHRGVHKNGKHIWFYGFAKILKHQADGITPAIAICVMIDFSKEIGTIHQLNELVKENNRLKNQLLISNLTRKEKEVLKLIANGNSDKEIAKLHFISDQTVHTHRKNILRKLNLKNAAALVKFAVESGLS